MTPTELRAYVQAWIEDGSWDLADHDDLTTEQRQSLAEIQHHLETADRYRCRALATAERIDALNVEIAALRQVGGACRDGAEHRRNLAALELNRIAPTEDTP